MNTAMMDAARESVESLSDRLAGILRTQSDLSGSANLFILTSDRTSPR